MYYLFYEEWGKLSERYISPAQKKEASTFLLRLLFCSISFKELHLRHTAHHAGHCCGIAHLFHYFAHIVKLFHKAVNFLQISA
jgi:hypothetical protein